METKYCEDCKKLTGGYCWKHQPRTITEIKPSNTIKDSTGRNFANIDTLGILLKYNET